MAKETLGIINDYRGGLLGCRYGFAGINNIIDASNIDLSTGEVVDAINVDFDNTNSANRRLGYSKVFSGNYHSAFNNDTRTKAYFVLNDYIYEFDGTTPYPIIQVTPNLRMEFCSVNDVIAYSNGIDFGVIGAVNNQTRTYSPDFKQATMGGRNLEFYNGRLYFSRENTIYCTDVFDIEHVDIRVANIATFAHNITMIKRVEDGLWVGTEQYVYFLRGDDIREGGFEQQIITKAGVVYGTACKINAEDVPEAQARNNIVIFLSTIGICSGAEGGKFTNHSFNTVSLDVGTSGVATIKKNLGYTQYLVSFDVDSAVEYNPYNYIIPVEVNTI